MADQATPSIDAATEVPPAQSSDAVSARELSEAEYPMALALSEKLRKFVDFVGRSGSWFILPLVIITCVDVVARKIRWQSDDGTMVGVQIWLVENFGPVFSSTLLQEMEWHFHTGLFALVLGYGYIWNTHVRVDLVRETLHFRKKAWIELLGLTFFLIPYTATVVYFATIFAYDSFMVNEISASLVGLSHRWMIKSVLVIGLVVAVIAGLAVWLQVWVALFGEKNVRFPLMTLEWPEEEGSKIEGKERLDLDKATDELRRRATESGHLKNDNA
jgi:TRAP-type mannitol/chloroaromatic compound transport system permease small subunit